ncbi:MAG: hypothetical protein ABW061_01935, partial [Polyangiaceae bacterium]
MTNLISKRSIAAAAAVIGAAIFAPIVVSAPEPTNVTTQPAEHAPTYTWSAELVTFEPASNVLTVKARVVATPETANLSALRAGDRAMLTWSGITWGSGVRAVERGNTSKFDRMTMPVEFVASELDGRYVAFKLPVPAAQAAAIAKLEPGEFVTATSPWRATSAA